MVEQASKLYRRKSHSPYHVIAVKTKDGYKKGSDTPEPFEKVDWAREAIADRKKFGKDPSIV